MSGYAHDLVLDVWETTKVTLGESVLTLGELFRIEFEKHPICQRCERNESKVMPTYGSHFAVCEKCWDQMEELRNSYMFQDEEF